MRGREKWNEHSENIIFKYCCCWCYCRCCCRCRCWQCGAAKVISFGHKPASCYQFYDIYWLCISYNTFSVAAIRAHLICSFFRFDLPFPTVCFRGNKKKISFNRKFTALKLYFLTNLYSTPHYNYYQANPYIAIFESMGVRCTTPIPIKNSNGKYLPM